MAGNRPPGRAFRLDFPPPARQTEPMDQPSFRHVHRVTYADCTVGNHIYYSRYLDLLEAARGEFFRHLGATFLKWQEQEIIFPVVECRLRYKAPARYDDVLTIELWPTAAERIRLDFSSRILNQSGVLILEAETRHVCTGLDEKPRRLPEELVKLLGPWVRS
jgi:acyl-CoA thioester hydrolase